MDEHPIQGLMTTAMENLKGMIEVNTIVGDAVESPDGSVIIPVSKLGFGFAAGGSEFNSNSSGSENGEAVLPFGGGSGGGVSITPVAFLIVNEKGVKMVHLDESVHIYEKMIDFAPKAVDKIQQMLKDSKSSNQSKPKNKEQNKAHSKENKQQKKPVEHHEENQDLYESDYDI